MHNIMVPLLQHDLDVGELAACRRKERVNSEGVVRVDDWSTRTVGVRCKRTQLATESVLWTHRWNLVRALLRTHFVREWRARKPVASPTPLCTLTLNA